jgi:hypothetical protein
LARSENPDIDITGLWPEDHPTYRIVGQALMTAIDEARVNNKPIDSFMVAIDPGSRLQAAVRSTPHQVTLLFLLPTPSPKAIVHYIDRHYLYTPDGGAPAASINMATLLSEEDLYIIRPRLKLDGSREIVVDNLNRHARPNPES